MKKIKFVFIFFGIFLAFFSGYHFDTVKGQNQCVQEITIEDYRELIAGRNEFFLYVGRPSCRYCAVVSSYVLTMESPPLPVYFISLEPFWGCDDYEAIKSELETTYLPCFKYVSEGQIRYSLNSPLDTAYFDLDGPGRMELYARMKEKINAFFNGSIGLGPVIDETPPVTETVHALPENTTKENHND